MTTFFDKLRKLIRLKTTPERETAVPPAPVSPPLTDPTIQTLMQQVETTQENQYNCEATFALLDEYVETVMSKEDAATLMPLVERHLQACPKCNEHYEALLTILQTEP
ncbi:MAG: zf-HC2 domain-containing protein [Chloroflexi bacterium]|nr:zf-HC2 domain-containing protein [Chloroflexota bacterium]